MKGKKSLLSKVFLDIQELPIKNSDSFNTIRRKFYDVMRKHGIKQGTREKKGAITISNPEWKAAEWLLEERIRNFVSLGLCLSCFKTPRDLEAY